MSEKLLETSQLLLEKYENQLNAEKWTRATINNYTIKNFEELNILIEEIRDYHVIPEIKGITENYLKNNKNSIVALYISTIFQIDDGILENNNVYSLLKIFTDNMKWNIVEYLCNIILQKVSDKIVLRSLIDAYNNLNKKELLPDLWEKLIRVDYEEANLVVKLAELKEENDEFDDAISYYKKAINRYILNKNFTQVEELWKKLLTFDDISYEFFLNLDKKITNNFNIERSIELLTVLYDIYKEKEDFDICLRILKIILEKEPENEYCRTEIVTTYRLKYADHSQLDEYVKKSNLEGRWRNIADAIIEFERHIVFDKGNFVYHRTWGLGVIKDITKDVFTIDFQKAKNHKMSLKVALNSLKVLPKNHIWILKLKNISKLKEKVKSDVKWALKVLINSFENKASMKNFKEELCPDILTNSEWNSWWTKAKKLLKTDPLFGSLDENNDIYELRDKPLTFEEKIYNSFKAAKDFNQRFNLIIDYIENTDPDSDFLEDMVNYFLSFLNSINNVNEQTFSSYLLLKDIQNKFPFINIKFNYEFAEFVEQIEDPIEIYEKISLSDYKKDFLYQLKKVFPEWKEVFNHIFYQYPHKFLYDELANIGWEEKIVKELITAYKEFREAFFWIVTNALNPEKSKRFNIDYDNIIFSLIHLVELTGKDVSLKKDTVKNKKVSSQIKDYLFKNDFLLGYIKKSGKEFSKRLFSISSELLSMEAENIIKIKNQISELYPDIDVEDQSLKFDISTSKTSIIDKLLLTEESYNKLHADLINIKEVEIPKNSKEIGEAMEKGDLKENAEYKAAKEHQALLQSKLTKIMNDLSQATIIKKDEISNDFVTFGTIVKLEDKINNNTIEYTILGPHESNTEKNIISYQSPLGAKLLDKKPKEEIKFILNDKEYHYIIKEIKVAKF
ncbi:MAG: transcription elongation factor GreA [Spirochaetes bacterium]|nr:transcription elongation factor GreA [Spirochaetota bacterium]